MIDINKFVGVPYVKGGVDYSGADCYGLAALFYRDEMGIDLPFFDGDDGVEANEVDEPFDGALIRCVSKTNQADHWAVYYKGKVINAQSPSSAVIDFKRFVNRHPVIEFYEVVL